MIINVFIEINEIVFKVKVLGFLIIIMHAYKYNSKKRRLFGNVKEFYNYRPLKFISKAEFMDIVPKSKICKKIQ